MRDWHCQYCGKSWKTDETVAVHFHRCRPPTKRRRREWTLPELEADTLEEAFHDVFSDFAGGPQQISTEEARAETDRGYGGRP